MEGTVKVFFGFSYLVLIVYISLSLQEKLYGKPLIVADREMVEEKIDGMLSEASESDVAFLVVGDPFGWVFHFPLLIIFTECWDRLVNAVSELLLLIPIIIGACGLWVSELLLHVYKHTYSSNSSHFYFRPMS